jgi:hypothetical protein
MKLLRLGTDNDNCIFDTKLKQTLVVPPFSKIGLLDFTAELRINTIDININNNKITYTIGALIEFIAELSFGSYGRSNYQDLLNDITLAMNQSLFYEISEFQSRSFMLGVEWLAQEEDSKINIGYKIGTHSLHESDLDLAATVQIVGPPPTAIISMLNTTPATEDYDNSILGIQYVSQGVGYVRTKVALMTDVGGLPDNFLSQGFMIGLSETDLSVVGAENFTADMATYGCGIGYEGGAWKYYTRLESNAPVDYGLPVKYIAENNTDNADIEVIQNGAFIQMAIYDTDLNPVTYPGYRRVLLQIPFDGSKQLYPFIVFHSNEDDLKVRLFRWTPSPYINVPSTETDIVDLGLTPPSNGKRYRQNFLSFQSITLANFLGFNNTRIPVENYIRAIEHDYIADNEFGTRKYLTNYLLELLNLNVESYDGTQNQRKNILAGILTSDENGIINNNKGTVIFIDLNNKESIDLRNLKMRLVGLDYTPIEINGKSIATLLIADKNETSF